MPQSTLMHNCERCQTRNEAIRSLGFERVSRTSRSIGRFAIIRRGIVQRVQYLCAADVKAYQSAGATVEPQ